MEEILKQLLEGQKQILGRLDSLDAEVKSVKGQQSENSNFIQALLHQSEELDAKFDGLLHTTASKDAFKTLDAKLDRVAADMTFLVRKAAEHEDDIRNLKLIK